MVIAAGRAASQVRAHERHLRVGGSGGQFEFDLDIEQLEALIAADLGVSRADQLLDQALGIIWHVRCHLHSPSMPSRGRRGRP